MSRFKGNRFAKAAIDLAWWDLRAKQLDLPLWKVLGGLDDVIQVGADLGVMDRRDELLAMIQTAVEEGFKRVKLKYHPGWVLEMIKSVRGRFPQATIHIDCNSAYSLADIDMFKAVDELDVPLIEQPLAHDDLLDHAKLQSMLRTPVCLDESITSSSKARKAIQLGACR